MVTDDERRAFSERLNWALDRANFEPKGLGRQTKLGIEMGVSQKGARKWLEGEAIPETARLIALARRLDVAFEWLATGRGDRTLGAGTSLDDVSLRIATLASALTETQRTELVNQLERQVSENEKMLAELSARKLTVVGSSLPPESELLKRFPSDASSSQRRKERK